MFLLIFEDVEVGIFYIFLANSFFWLVEKLDGFFRMIWIVINLISGDNSYSCCNRCGIFIGIN